VTQVYVFNQNLFTNEVVVVPITAGIPQILSPSPRYYRGFCPHSCGNTAVIVTTTAVITAVTAVIPPSPSLCYFLVNTIQKTQKTQIENADNCLLGYSGRYSAAVDDLNFWAERWL